MINYRNVDKVLEMYYSHLPYGVNYFTLTYKLNFKAEEWEAMYDYLLDGNFIEHFGSDDKQILTPKGLEVLKIYGGMEDYLKAHKKNKQSTGTKTKVV